MKLGRWWVTAAQFTGVGWYVAAAIVVPVLAGAWLDERFGTAPALLLVGVVLGVAMAFYGLFKIVDGLALGRDNPSGDD